MNNNKNDLRNDSIDFAIEISDICDEIKGCSVYTTQLVRSSSSIGANIYEAKYAQSRADFASKLNIALKEAKETDYWLRLLHATEYISDGQFQSIIADCDEIESLLVSIVKASKN